MTPPGRPQSFRNPDRLRRKEDFDRAYREGIRVQGRLVALIGCANRLGHARLGVSASRRLGGATVRNRVRRRIREFFRRESDLRSCSVDLVVSPRGEAGASDSGAFDKDLRRACHILCKRIAPRS